MAKQVIEIVTEVRDKASGKLKNLSKVTKELNQNTGKVIETTRRISEKTGRYNIVQRKTTRGMRTFQFEWLSVMFAGMALNRVFGGIIRTQSELFGINELLGSILTISLIPAMESLLVVSIFLFDAFDKLPEPLQGAIGWFIALMAILGLVTFVIGSVMLAVGGLAILFKISAAAIFASLFGVIIIIAGIALVIVGVTMIVKNWGKNWEAVVRGIALVLLGLALILIGLAIIFASPFLFMIAIILIVAAVIAIFVAFVIRNWKEIKEKAKIALEAIGGFFKKWFWEKPKEWLEKLLGKVKEIWDKITSIFKKGQKGSVTVSGAGGGEVNEVDDFILKPDGSVIKTNPKDFLFGTKNPERLERVGGGGTEIIINQTINASGSNTKEFEELIKENNIKLVSDLRRLIQE